MFTMHIVILFTFLNLIHNNSNGLQEKLKIQVIFTQRSVSEWLQLLLDRQVVLIFRFF